MSLQWDRSKLARVEAQVGIPPNWNREIRGMKLVARDRAELIGKAECMYGLSGQASPCTAEKEAGLAFALVETPYEEMQAQITDPAPSPVTVAGREGIRWEIGAEGEGADYTMLPAYTGTILIVRQYRTSGNPDAAAIAQVFDSLSFDG